ncbi:MAG: PHP-associated domain-containing protein [Candidatus Auribacterota bacterium]|nr:PHP-associated domain-containing protein [Candidatus Auribacterota bacterium]
MPRFKADLHLHSSHDFLDRSMGCAGLMSPFECIDMARSMGYQVLSFTHHGILYEDKDVTQYARKNEILLIPGTECFINRKHVLLYNFRVRSAIETFDDIRMHKNDDNLVVAPHPFYPSSCCLQNQLIENIDCFDALEYSHFYTQFYNPNRKMLEMSEAFRLPVVGFSDMHCATQFGTTYSLVDADDFSTESIIHAIKAGRVEVVTQPLPLLKFFAITWWFVLRFRLSSRHIRKNILSIQPECIKQHVDPKK